MMLQHFEALAKAKKFDELRVALKSAYIDSKDPTSFLINTLTITDVPQLRNEVAMLLKENPDERAIEPLVDMIVSNRTNLNKGNLLVALEQLDYTPYCDILFELLVNGYFEISRKSYQMLDANKGKISKDTKSKGIQRIKSKIDDLEGEIEFLYDALQFLDT